MCMTMGDPAWAFVLAATEIRRLTVQLLMCRPFKIPLSVVLPQLSVALHMDTHAHNLFVRQTSAHTHTPMIIEHCSKMIAFTLGLHQLFVLVAEQVCDPKCITLIPAHT